MVRDKGQLKEWTLNAEDGLIGRVRARLYAHPIGGRPFVTVSYAQSIDGSIAATPGYPTAISHDESARMSHRLRALHDCVMVGIGTVLSDDPRLTVRLVDGRDPQPVILDTRLRFPLNARLFSNGTAPWVMAGQNAGMSREADLKQKGCHVFRTATDHVGRIDLGAALKALSLRGTGSVLVEGGARIITSFLADRLVDQIVITIAPLLMGGLHAPEPSIQKETFFPQLANVDYERFGKDMVVRGDTYWQ